MCIYIDFIAEYIRVYYGTYEDILVLTVIIGCISISFCSYNGKSIKESHFLNTIAWQHWTETYDYLMTFHPIFRNHREKY